MRHLIAVLCWLITAVPAMSQIEGPATSDPGDLIILSAVGEFESCAWILANSDKTYLPVEGGTKVVFASGKPGDYVFILATSIVDEDAAEVETRIFRHVVKVSGDVPDPGPNPDPDIPDPPDLTGLAKGAFDAVSQCETTSLEATQAAGNLRATASKAAGLSSMTVADINADLVTRNRRVPFSSDDTKQRWSRFFQWFASAMTGVQDRDAAIQAFNDIADGLEASAGRTMDRNVSRGSSSPSIKSMLQDVRSDLEQIRSEVGN